MQFQEERFCLFIIDTSSRKGGVSAFIQGGTLGIVKTLHFTIVRLLKNNGAGVDDGHFDY